MSYLFIRCSQASPLTSSNEDEGRLTPSYIPLKNQRLRHTTFLESVGQTSVSSSRASTPRSTPLINLGNNGQATNCQEKIIRDLETLKAIQDQHTIILQEILSTVKTKNVQALTRPSDTPDLPIAHKNDFRTFESWLENPTNFTYMVRVLIPCQLQ